MEEKMPPLPPVSVGASWSQMVSDGLRWSQNGQGLDAPFGSDPKIRTVIEIARQNSRLSAEEVHRLRSMFYKLL